MGQNRLDNFLGCCHLESGGYFYGYFGVIGSLVSVVLSILAIVGLRQGSFDDEFLQRIGFTYLNKDHVDRFSGVLLAAGIFFIIYMVIYFVVSALLIRATEDKNQHQVIFVVYFYGVNLVLSLTTLYTLTTSSVICVLMSIYAFAVIYALWRKFQEHDDKASPPYQSSMDQSVIPISGKLPQARGFSEFP